MLYKEIIAVGFSQWCDNKSGVALAQKMLNMFLAKARFYAPIVPLAKANGNEKVVWKLYRRVLSLYSDLFNDFRLKTQDF